MRLMLMLMLLDCDHHWISLWCFCCVAVLGFASSFLLVSSLALSIALGNKAF